MRKYSLLVSGYMLCAGMMSLVAQGPTFKADASFQGSSLDGWHSLGSAKWSATQGEIVGDAKGGSTAGLLVLDHSYQDPGVYLSFRCEGPCNGGLMVRAVKDGDHTHGFLLAITDDGLTGYSVTLDSDGKEISRKELRRAGGQIRFAPPPPDPAAAQGAQRPFIPRLRPMPAGVESPLEHPVTGVQKGKWNELEILLDADILRAFMNDGGGQASVATDDMDSYGPIALYVAPGSEIHFRNVAWTDLGFKTEPVEKVSASFRMQRLSPFYYGWSADAADFNRDGHLDIVSGPFIYYGPDFTRFREIYPAQIVNASTQYSMDDWVEHAYDFTGDGWPDVLTTSHAGGGKVGAVLYVNPKGESRRWEKHTVVAPIDSEETLIADVDGDGKRELVYVGDGYMRYARPDPKDPTGKWIVHTVSEQGPWPAHGIGVGDINGNGLMDIVGAYGWWEHPKDNGPETVWKYHPEPFGRWGRESAGGATIAVYDVNGDGLNDVVTSLQAHGSGIVWFEQKRSSKGGEISFVPHTVMGDSAANSAGGVYFTEPHGSTVADVDGDGIPDFVIGKRFWSHLDDYYDPDPYGAEVLYWYKTVRDPKAPGGARLVPELIHNRSGVGSDVLACDLNGDGVVDIVTSTRSGTYIFWGTRAKQAKVEKQSGH